jgi:hypothetical protein
MSDEPISMTLENYRLTVERDEGGALVRLSEISGGEALRVTIGPDGPTLHFGQGLRVTVSGELAFTADRVAIHGREGVELRSGEDLVLECKRDLAMDAREHHIRARLGDVVVEANDDIKLDGERIRLNC